MPRQPRLDAPGTLHHVIGRGIEGSKIFRDPGDRKDFLDRIGSGGEDEADAGVEGKGSRSEDVVVKGIKERKGGGSEGARGGSETFGGGRKESILPAGGEENWIFWGGGCEVFGGNHFIGQSVCQFRGSWYFRSIPISCV